MNKMSLRRDRIKVAATAAVAAAVQTTAKPKEQPVKSYEYNVRNTPFMKRFVKMRKLDGTLQLLKAEYERMVACGEIFFETEKDQKTEKALTKKKSL